MRGRWALTRLGGSHRFEHVGRYAMGILIIIAMVWLCVRIVAGLRLLTEVRDQEVFGPPGQDVTDPDGVHTAPQDARFDPQDAAPADLEDLAPPEHEGAATAVTAMAVWREVAQGLRELAARRLLLAEVLRDDGVPESPGDPHGEWLAALRETIIETVPRPDAGPACLGGRDDGKYLRGWDDAVDWVSQGRDAEPPTWGDVAYMTGWNDAVTRIATARRSARAWPTPVASAA
jgi:hypothetical protein